MEIPIPHYPPYTSKYNPIGHRFFPHISPLCQGLIFESVQTVKDLMAGQHPNWTQTLDYYSL
jgi:hypothetical protein